MACLGYEHGRASRSSCAPCVRISLQVSLLSDLAFSPIIPAGQCGLKISNFGSASYVPSSIRTAPSIEELVKS